MSPRPARATKAELRRVLELLAQAPGEYAVELMPCGTIRIAPNTLRPTQPVAKPQVDYFAGVKL